MSVDMGADVIDVEAVEVLDPAPAGHDLVLLPHPLTLDGRTITRGVALLPGDTLATLLQRNGVDLGQRGAWVVTIGGALVPELLWSRTKPQHGHLIEVRRVAGKGVVRFAALVALAYFTLGTGLAAGGLSGWLGGGLAGGFIGYAINVGAFVLGSMVINRLLPPPGLGSGAYNNETGTTYSLAGARNGARRYEPIGLLFGSVRVVPDFAALPYAWFQGEDQYQYIRLHGGINTQDVTALKIGDTNIGDYQGVTVTKAAFPGISTKLDMWNSVDSLPGGLLDAPTSPGSWVVRTTSVNTVRISVDVAAQLYKINDDGNAVNSTLQVDMEYRLLPGGSWLPFVGGTSTYTFQHKTTKPLRFTLVIGVAKAQYEVRMRKVTANSTTTRSENTVEWVALKSVQEDPEDYDGLPQVGITIKASGQLNGTLNEVSWLATSRPTQLWDGTTWNTVTTSNPGAALLQFIGGIYATGGKLLAGLGKGGAQIDLDSIKGWMVHCTAMGYRFDHWFDRAASCGEVLDAICAAGMASISYHTGKIGVVWAQSGQPVETIISPVRMKPGSFRIEYATRELADELEVTSLDRDTNWQPASLRLKAPGVSMPRETARLAPVGVTTLAGRLMAGRLTMAQNIYQRKAVSWDMDLEYLNFRRFSVVALSHDLTQWGHSGRLHAAANAAGVVTLTLDEEVPFNSGAAGRWVALHLPGEVGYRVFGVVPFTGTAHTLTLSGSWPAGVPLPGNSPSNPAHDTVWLYDFSNAPGKRLRVVSIEPVNNLAGARITAVPEPDEFWTYVASGAYEAPPSVYAPQPVVASNLRITQSRVDVNYDGVTELLVSFDATGPYDHAEVWGASTGEPLVRLGETRTTLFTGWRVATNGGFSVEVRPFDGLGRPGAVLSGTHTISLATAIALGALAAADAAQAAADQANADIAVVVNDGLLSRDEKPGEVLRYSAINAGYASLDGRAASYGITTERTAYAAALSALGSYLGGLSPSWSDATVNTAIVRATYISTWAAVYAAQQTLMDKIAQVAGTLAVWTGVTGSGRPADNATVGKSLGLPFAQWNLNTQVLVTSSDGKVGSEVLRLYGASGAYPNQGTYVPIDRSKTYRTRFWARPSAAAAGVLRFSLRQFTDNAGTYGPDNSGRSPYKPGGVTRAAHEAAFGGSYTWGEYSHTWTAADWQTGVKYVQPEFLDNYSVQSGWWEVQDFSFEEVTEVVTAQAAATAAAGAAADAQADADTANLALADIASDNVLTRGEKPAVILDWTALGSEQAGIDARATAYGITTEKTAYDNAITALGSYLGGLSPGWSDLSQDTPITGSTFRGYFASVYSTRQALLNKIAEAAGTVATWSGVSGSGKPADNATVNRVFYSASAPGSPVDGDVWVDTSGSPSVTKLRVSGAWQAGANLSTGALAMLNAVGMAEIVDESATKVAESYSAGPLSRTTSGNYKTVSTTNPDTVSRYVIVHLNFTYTATATGAGASITLGYGDGSSPVFIDSFSLGAGATKTGAHTLSGMFLLGAGATGFYSLFLQVNSGALSSSSTSGVNMRTELILK